ncbi:unnamed protein product [Protopolystoma xenopodis]|uniref:Ion transport domain-containing protein n=1 Tax=Protopolystoma xenopodis TaxID=117903 RepID=A0A3S5B2P9_9PLAT|nr:unnamed protein product [Protopolystoma xenopodis]
MYQQSQSAAGQKEFAVVFWWNRPTLKSLHTFARIGSKLNNGVTVDASSWHTAPAWLESRFRCCQDPGEMRYEGKENTFRERKSVQNASKASDGGCASHVNANLCSADPSDCPSSTLADTNLRFAGTESEGPLRRQLSARPESLMFCALLRHSPACRRGDKLSFEEIVESCPELVSTLILPILPIPHPKVIFLYVRLFRLYAVNQKLGPKLVMIKNMVTDLLTFVYILAVVVVSYGVAVYAIMEPRRNVFSLDVVKEVILFPYLTLYGELLLDFSSGRRQKSPLAGAIFCSTSRHYCISTFPPAYNNAGSELSAILKREDDFVVTTPSGHEIDGIRTGNNLRGGTL